MTLQRETNTNEFITLITRLSQELQQHAEANLQSALVHAEEAFKRILLTVYGYKLRNANEDEHNAPGVDLIDDEGKFVFQITISATRDKVTKTLSRKAMEGYANDGYRLRFMFVGVKKLPRPKSDFPNPHSIGFDYRTDCLYCADISEAFSRLDIAEQERALHVLKQELGEAFLLTTEKLTKQFESSKRLLGVRYSPNLSVPVDAFRYLDTFSNPQVVKENARLKLFELSHACKKAVDLEGLDNEKRQIVQSILEASAKAEDEVTQSSLEHIDSSAEALENVYSPNDEPEEIRSLLHECRILRQFRSNVGFAFTEKKFVLFTGNGGIGKSHYLADCCERAIKKGDAAFLILGQEFTANQGPCSQIAVKIAGDSDYVACFSEINRFAESHGHRAIIAIDALNEGIGRNYWPDHLASLVEALRPFNSIILLASVRSTYEGQVIPVDCFKEDASFSRIQLTGFSNSPDAIRLFCEHYHIEPPAFPPYGEEYSNPLYLRTLCEAISEKGTNTFELSISFTEAVSLCLNGINKRICKELECQPATNIVHKALTALVDTPSFLQWGFIAYDDAIQSVHSAIHLYTGKAVKVIELLEAESAINVDTHGQDSYISFSYERFGDYVCAHHAISQAASGSPSRKETICKNKEIREMLCSEYMQGAAEALSILLSETEDISVLELLDLDDEDEESRAFDLLLSTIPWDKTNSVSPLATKFIKENVTPNPNRTILLVSELLDVALSPSNAFNAKVFEDIARSLPVQERECILAWAMRENANVPKTLSWLKKNYGIVSNECIQLALTLLPWLTSSSSIEIRDKATQTLSCCLLRRPSEAQALAEKIGSFEDDYVDERLIAAIYGAASNSENRLVEFLPACRTAYKFAYEGGSTHPNIMIRNYIDCLVDLMRVRGLIDADECRLCSSRGNSPWYEAPVSNEEIDGYLTACKSDFGEQSKEAFNLWWIIHSMTTEYGRGTCAYGDFGRYVFGSQVGCWNSQFKNDQDLANLALKELLDNFYSTRWHASFDNRVRHSREDNNLGFERISKKYQWICMYRLIGRLVDNYPPYEEKIEYDQEYLEHQRSRGARFWTTFADGGNSPVFEEDEELDPNDHIVSIERRPLEADEMFWQLGGLRDFDPTYLALHEASSEGAGIVASKIPNFSIEQSEHELCELLTPFHETEINSEKYVSIWSLFTIKEPNGNTRETHWQSFAVVAGEQDMLNSLKDKKKLSSDSSYTPETLHVYSRETGGYLASRLDNEFRIRDMGEDRDLLAPISVGYLWEPIRDGANDSGESRRIQNPSYDLAQHLGLVQDEPGVWKSNGTTVCIEKTQQVESAFTSRKSGFLGSWKKGNFCLDGVSTSRLRPTSSSVRPCGCSAYEATRAASNTRSWISRHMSLIGACLPIR